MKPTVSFLSALLLAAPTLLPGCGTGATQCTDLAAFSVLVTVVDDMGAVQADVNVTFSVDGGQEQTAQCFSPAGFIGCKSWGAGVEQTGVFTIKAVSLDGLRHAEASVTVNKDECHVIGQNVKLTLM